MIRLVFALAVALALAGMTGAAPAAAQNPAPAAAPNPAPAAVDPQTVVARVGSAEIRMSDVAAAHEQLPEQYRQMPLSALFGQLVDQLVDRQLMLKAGLEQKLGEDAAVRSAVREFEGFAIQRAYLDRYLAKAVTDAALRKEYDTTFGAGKGEDQVKASHILLQTEADALAVLKELAGGADFAQLARDRSTGPSASNGGDLGFFSREQMVTPFSEAAFALKDGEVGPDPVKSQFGWHVIKVTGRRTQPPPAFEAVREQLRDRLTRDALEAHMAELRDATTVERFNPDGTPMEQGAGKK